MSTQSEQGIPQLDLTDRLWLALRKAGLTQQQIADELGYSRASVGHYMTGVAKPRRIVIRAWALRCGVDPDWLETGHVSDRELCMA